MDIDAKLAELFIELPEPHSISGGLVHTVRSGHLLFLGGILPYSEGRLMMKGKVGIEIRPDAARLAARQAAISMLAILRAEVGFSHIQRILRLEGAIASGGDFRDHGKVMDGASELLMTLFGPKGIHVRTCIGVVSLPFDAPLQLSGIIEVK